MPLPLPLPPRWECVVETSAKTIKTIQTNTISPYTRGYTGVLTPGRGLWVLGFGVPAGAGFWVLELP